MWCIAARELRSFFFSPLAWTILAVIQIVMGLVFNSQVALFLQPGLQAELSSTPGAPGLTDIVVSVLFLWMSIVLLLAMPLLTMRLISEERRNNTLPLLLSSPTSMTGIILGKYLGLMGFFLVMIAILLLMPLSLLLGGLLDLGQLASSLLGLILLTGAFAAIGLYISTLTAQPTIAAIGTFGILLLLWIIDWGKNTTNESELLTYLSILNHYQALVKGLFKTQDVIYYLLIIALFLILSVQRLDAERM